MILFLALRFEAPVRSLLEEVPRVIPRLRAARGLGLELEMDKIEEELPLAEKKAQTISVDVLPAQMRVLSAETANAQTEKTISTEKEREN